MTTVAFSGQLSLRPGTAKPAIASTRLPLADKLLRGTPAAQAPAKLASLYALCGDAHRLTAQLAIDAARGLRSHPTAAELSALTAETMREHVRRIWLDWPRLFGADGEVAAMAALRSCPLFPGKCLPDALAMRGWIESALLGEPIQAWLKSWRAAPVAWLDGWAEQGATRPARLLHGIAEEARELHAAALPLLPHADATTLMQMARAIGTDARFEKLPTWQGKCCETGSWNRLTDAGRSFGHEARGTWFRLGARVAELAALAVVGSETQAPLALGALRIAPGDALAWSEMARGLLLHRVRLEQGSREPVIAEYRIVAPTEWNFHPQGVVADLLARMPAAKTAAQCAQQSRSIAVLAAAFDPCITYQIEFEYA